MRGEGSEEEMRKSGKTMGYRWLGKQDPEKKRCLVWDGSRRKRFSQFIPFNKKVPEFMLVEIFSKISLVKHFN